MASPARNAATHLFSPSWLVVRIDDIFVVVKLFLLRLPSLLLLLLLLLERHQVGPLLLQLPLKPLGLPLLLDLLAFVLLGGDRGEQGRGEGRAGFPASNLSATEAKHNLNVDSWNLVSGTGQFHFYENKPMT